MIVRRSSGALLALLTLFLHSKSPITQRGYNHVRAVADAATASQQGRRVLLSSVQSLVFSEDETTKSRIGEPISKLTCVGGDCVGRSAVGRINQAHCRNEGVDDTGLPSWRCTASMPKGCKFKTTTVSCEGLSGPDDEYILPGSCALMYSTVCERTEDVKREESELRRRIRDERERQQEEVLAEVERVRGQAAKDECELKVAGALYPIMQEVEVKRPQHGTNDGSWTRGYVGVINCDGTYRVDFRSKIESPAARSMYSVQESDMRVAVNPIYLEEDVSAPAGFAFRRRAQPAPETSSLHKAINDENVVTVLVCAFLLLLCIFCCSNHDLFIPNLTEASVIKCLYDSPGHRLRSRDIRRKLRDAIEKENSRDAGRGDEMLRQFLFDVAVEDGYADNSGFPPPNTPGSDDLFFRLRPDQVAREQEREKDRLERERRGRELREQERRRRERYAKESRERERRRRERHAWESKGRERRKQETYEYPHTTSTTAPMRHGNIQTSRLDEEAMERLREVKTKMLAAQAELRVARVKAKQNQNESARIQEFQTRIEQLQRDIENDTSELGNVMQRFDALMEEYEAVGYASTKIR